VPATTAAGVQRLQTGCVVIQLAMDMSIETVETSVSY